METNEIKFPTSYPEYIEYMYEEQLVEPDLTRLAFIEIVGTVPTDESVVTQTAHEKINMFIITGYLGKFNKY